MFIIGLVVKFLNEHPEKIANLRAARKLNSNFFKGTNQQNATALDVKEWLRLNDKKWSEDKIRSIMNVNERLRLNDKKWFFRSSKGIVFVPFVQPKRCCPVRE